MSHSDQAQYKRLVDKMVGLRWPGVFAAVATGGLIQVTLTEKLTEAERQNAREALKACGAKPVDAKETIWDLKDWKISFTKN